MPSNIAPVFVKAKRVRIRSNPLGLGLLVDHQPIQPGPVFTASYSGDPYCPVSLRPAARSASPVGYTPLCVGDFDFIPGSTHLLAAPLCKSDSLGKTWVFAGFSNGLGQNSIYTANFDTSTTDTFFANFTATVPTEVVTSPPGLTVNVDGQNHSKGASMLWAEGQTHHLIAPPDPDRRDRTSLEIRELVQRRHRRPDLHGSRRPDRACTWWRIISRPGKLQVTSVPSGLPFMVDGAACTTPCVLLDKPTGATGASDCTPIGNAGCPQPLHFRFLEWRKHRHFVPGHHWRSGAGVHGDVSDVL